MPLDAKMALLMCGSLNKKGVKKASWECLNIQNFKNAKRQLMSMHEVYQKGARRHAKAFRKRTEEAFEKADKKKNWFT